jgi:hypothetical protein
MGLLGTVAIQLAKFSKKLIEVWVIKCLNQWVIKRSFYVLLGQAEAIRSIITGREFCHSVSGVDSLSPTGDIKGVFLLVDEVLDPL